MEVSIAAADWKGQSIRQIPWPDGLVAGTITSRVNATALCRRRYRFRIFRPSVVALNLADADQVVDVPNLSTLLFRDKMFRMPRESLDRRKILPVYHRDSGSIRISGGFNADVSFIALGNFEYIAVCSV
jgi:hypothetical protein